VIKALSSGILALPFNGIRNAESDEKEGDDGDKGGLSEAATVLKRAASLPEGVEGR
jgi:hypothetical protein